MEHEYSLVLDLTIVLVVAVLGLSLAMVAFVAGLMMSEIDYHVN